MGGLEGETVKGLLSGIVSTVAVAAMLGAGTWWYVSREIELPSVPEDVEVDLSLQGVRLSQGSEGRKAWSLEANSASFDEESGMLSLKEPRVTYQGKTGDAPVFVQAPEGEVSQEKNTARMWPRVKATYQEYTVTAKQLDYVGKKDLITFTGDVVMAGENSVIRAPEASILLKEDVMTARGGVEAVMQDSGEIDLPGMGTEGPETGKEE